MNFDFLKDPGTIVVIVSIVIFYARIMFLREDRKRKKEIAVLKQKKERKGSKPVNEQQKTQALSDFMNPKYQITNWMLGGPGIVLMLIGVVSRTSDWLPAAVNPYWYVPTALGVLLLTFSINSK